MKNSNLQIRLKESEKTEPQYIPRDASNNLLWQQNSSNFCRLSFITNINIGLFYICDYLFWGMRIYFFESENNFHVPKKEIIRCKQDFY